MYGHVIGIYRSGERGGRKVGGGENEGKGRGENEGGERKCKEAKVK